MRKIIDGWRCYTKNSERVASYADTELFWSPNLGLCGCGLEETRVPRDVLLWLLGPMFYAAWAEATHAARTTPNPSNPYSEDP